MPLFSAFGGASRRGFGGPGVVVDGITIIPGPLSIDIAGGFAINLRNLALSLGWDSTSVVTATVSANVGSTSTGTPAMTISGSFPNGVNLVINSGVYLVGAGGNTLGAYNVGGAGGVALSVSSPTTVTNNGIIGGGGGAGGSCDGLGGGGAGLPGGVGAHPGTITNGGAGSGGQAGGAPGVAGVAAASYSYNGGGGGGLGANGGLGRYNNGGDATSNNLDPTDSVDRIWIGGDAAPAPTGDGKRINASVSAGTAGACTAGNANITWITTGTRYGALN